MTNLPIYLDYNASTPIDPRVIEAMRSALEQGYGNPSSTHWAGTPAKDLLEASRRQVGGLLQCAAGEVVFTSGGSEANNLALKGVFYGRRGRPFHLITTQIEHPSILNPCAFLEGEGARVTRLPVDGTGLVDPDALRRAITSDTALVSIMHANNETGTVEPIAECARIAREHGVLFHTDAAQSVGKIPTRVDELGVDLLSIAGHKLYAPKGVGALYVRSGTRLEPLIHGAGHESGRRAGTESALLATALGTASVLAANLNSIDTTRRFRDELWQGLKDHCGSRVVLNGHPELRLPNTLNVSFVGHTGADILATVPEIAASTGSACHAGRIELSPVLRAMGVSEEVGRGAIRFSLGRGTTNEDIQAAIARVSAAL
jgi:cysteine desulfurase